MIRSYATRIVEGANGKILAVANLFGLSTDEKPTEGYANGTFFIEVDTGKLYLFNETAGEWTEVQ